jgi:hypothetical protein
MAFVDSTARREEMQQQRDKYMNNELTHDQYYVWLSNFIRLPEIFIPASAEEVAECIQTDEHLNNIQLSRWDRMHGTVRTYAAGLHWSLCDTVCCLKALARRRYERK